MNETNILKALQESKTLTTLFEAAVEEVKRHATIACSEIKRIESSSRNKERDIQSRKRWEERKIQDEERLYNSVISGEENKINNWINRIEDPHFHKMKDEYMNELGNINVYCSENENPAQLMQRLKTSAKSIGEMVEKLDGAFIPPAVSGMIGFVIPPYRKKAYLEILKTRKEGLSIAEYLRTLNVAQSQREMLGTISESAQNDVLFSKNQQIAALKKEMGFEISKINRHFLSLYNEMYSKMSLFEEKENAIHLGKCWFINENVCVLRDAGLNENEDICIDDDKVGFDFSFDDMKENILFVYKERKSVASSICSILVDLMYMNEDIETIIIDKKGLGSTYPEINMLNGYDKFKILDNDQVIEKELDRLERWIVEENSCNSKDGIDTSKRCKKCIVIDDVFGNLNPNLNDQFLRIASNGAKVGLYIIGSIENDFPRNEVKEEFLNGLINASVALYMDDEKVSINDYTKIELVTEPDVEEISMIKNRFEINSKKDKVISVVKSLPRDDIWQQESSADGIKVEFGVDEKGNRAIYEISEERPYALVIGDVRVGKSSLIHTIIFQLLVHYSPKEVRIGIGDFKNGADFNIYAKSKLKAIDTVVNDEDPDAMLSFLKYYIQEMNNRQMQFEMLEDMTGELVRKYEEYRRVQNIYSIKDVNMPRIVLLIDEFQSLFDGAACSAYMTELVRKGATYGIHVILSSQRALSDNPKNGFTTSLKDYFTSRFVFKTPQAAARSVLSDRCADTGRENTGIQRASLLKRGQTIYNSYMGQIEADNSVVQCYFVAKEVITSLLGIISRMNGKGNSVLLRKNAPSIERPKGGKAINIGKSILLHRDYGSTELDVIHDDTEVTLDPRKLKNIILSGNDRRILESMISAVTTWRNSIPGSKTQLHIFGEGADINDQNTSVKCFYHEGIEEQLEELERQKNLESSDYIINVFDSPGKYNEYFDAVSSIRTNKGAELLKEILGNNMHKGLSIVYSNSFNYLKRNLPYCINDAPIHITSVGDIENVKYAMPDAEKIVQSEFDIPNRNTIKAYYYNKDTGKNGKVIMYLP